MGNCLVLQDKVVKIMKMDGKILEYKTPLKVHQVLSEFAGHAISDTHPVYRHLSPDTEMLSGRQYYLLPPSVASSLADKRMSMVSNPTNEPGRGTSVVRIKLVISRQELKEMSTQGGVSVDGMVSNLENNQTEDGVDSDIVNDIRSYKGRKPVLESIPEGSDSN